METRILEPSGSPGTSELVGELLSLPPLSPSQRIGGQQETSHSVSYSQEQESWGIRFVWGSWNYFPIAPEPTPFLGFGYGCLGGGALGLQACPSDFSDKLPCQ